tara:strand:- start:330 stop:1361 length:1032 start_codon:yes stop_codon:yes gene_type:complete
VYNKVIKPFLFLFDPELVHDFVFFSIKILNKIPFVELILRSIYTINNPKLKRKVLGIDFPNPIGLAAGFDKDAKLFKELSNFGFGFIEVGTVTPLKQNGNPKKRLFRLEADDALINRMGFNNEGVESLITRLKKKKDLIIGVNIGKNKNTDIQNSVNDYEFCFNKLHPYVDYFAINISSPNTPNLRLLQKKDALLKILKRLTFLNNNKSKQKPIFIKISPDIDNKQLEDIIDSVIKTKLSGIIATNTTLSRENLNSNINLKNESGGLSGKPLNDRSNEIIRFISKKSKKSFIIIGVGGIQSSKDAIDKIKAGADLIQIYTGFIYKGPGLIKKINKSLLSLNNN